MKHATKQSYRERTLVSMTRKAKKPETSQTTSRNLPASIVCQANTAIKARTTSAITIRPSPAGSRFIPISRAAGIRSQHLQKSNGAQGRIRTSVAHNAADLQSAAINHSATCARPATSPKPLPAIPLYPAQTPARSRERRRFSEDSGGDPCARTPGRAAAKTSFKTTSLRLPFRASLKRMELTKGFEPPTL